MKKLLIALAVLLFTAFSFSGVAYASYHNVEDFTEFEKRNYEALLNYIENSRTDVYIQDFYMQCELRNDPEVISDVLEMTAGITNNYDKAKEIHKKVVYYGYNLYDKIPEVHGFGGCYYDAKTIEAYMQAAGFPTKYIEGGFNGVGHAWNEVFIDGRWLLVDAAQMRFDTNPIDRSVAYTQSYVQVLEKEQELWDGSLYFFDSTNWKLLKEVKNFPLNGVVKSTYGFDIKDLYKDNYFEVPFTLNTMKVNSTDFYIMVKRPYTITINFDSKGGSKINPVEILFDNPDTVNYGVGQIKEPKAPTRAGYKFMGWYYDGDGVYVERKIDFNEDWFSGADYTLYAKWKKDTSKAKTYKVTFNSNKGTSVKALTVTANSTIKKPTNPTRKGYKFVAWYKDAKCTKKWVFAKDTVIKNTTLYAKWKSNT